MGDVFKKVQDSRNALEKLVSVVPGFKGYQERQERRAADQLMRQTLATKLANQRKQLERAQKALINKGQYEYLDDLGSAVTQLQTFADRVRLASYGYAGLFDAVKIRQEELAQLYSFDAALFEYVDRLDEATDRLREAISSEEGIEEVVGVILDICSEANSTFDEREHLILSSQ